MEEFEPKKKKTKLIKEFVSKNLYFIIIGLVLFLGVSYGITFFVQNFNVANGSFATGGLSINLSNQNINATNLFVPTSNQEGIQEFVKTLTITNNGNTDGNVKINLTRTSGLNLTDLSYSLSINGVIQEVNDVPSNGEILNTAIFQGETLNVEVRLWPKTTYSGSETTFVGELSKEITYLGLTGSGYLSSLDNLQNNYVNFNCDGNTCEVWRIVKVEDGRLVLTKEADLSGATSRVDSGKYNPDLTFNDNSMIRSVSTDNKNVYLAKTVKINGGEGTQNNPYVLINNNYSLSDEKIVATITYKDSDHETTLGTQSIYYGRDNYISRNPTDPENYEWSDEDNNIYALGDEITDLEDLTLFLHSKYEYHVFYSGIGATNLTDGGLLGKYDAMYHDGNTLNNISAGANATATNVTFGTDYMSFNGTTSYVNLGKMQNDYMTYEVIFSADEIPSSYKYIMANVYVGGMGIAILPSGEIRGVCYIDGDYRYTISSTIVEVGKKYHVALSYDGQDEVLYINGIEEARTAYSGVIAPPTSNSPMTLGAKSNGSNAPTYYFAGKIYGAAIYSEALDASQIAIDAGKQVAIGSEYLELPTPERKSHNFLGWYTAATGGTQITSQTLFTGNSDVTIYARWERINHIFYSGIGTTNLNNSNLLGKYDAMYHNGNSLYNIGANGQNGYATDVTFGTDYMQFNGTSSYVNLGYMSADYMTLEAVFSPDEISTSTVRYVIANVDLNGGGGGIRISTTNRIQGVFYINGDYRTVTSSTVVEVGKIYHAAVSYDGTALRLYINGIEEASTLEYAGYTIQAPASTATMMTLGARYSGSSPALLFKGKIYGAAIYNETLTASQIAIDAGKKLVSGATYGTLPTPSRKGYIFNGWYTAATGGTQVTPSTTFNGNDDTTIYARWEKMKHVFYLGIGATNLNNNNLLGKYDAMYHTGNNINNLSNNGIDVTATDVTFGTNYMSFNGTSSWVNLGQMNSNYMTIEVIFSVEQLPSATQYIITNIQSGGFGISITNSGLIQGFFHLNGDYRSIRSTTIIETGKMYHVAISYDGIKETLYINGIEEDSLIYSGYTIKTPVANTVVALGADPQGSSAVGNYFAGKIYGAAVYDTALTSSQISTDAGKNLTTGEVYGTLPTPSRKNYTFDGWYTAATGGTQITSSTTFNSNSDIAIYARGGRLNHVFYQGIGATRLNYSNVLGKFDAMYHNGNTLFNIGNYGYNGFAKDVIFGTNYMEFNGTSSWVNLGEMNSDYMTLEVMFSVDTLPTGLEYIMGNVDDGGIGINTSTHNLIEGAIYLNGAYRYVYSTTTIEAGKKYHVALKYDGTTMDLYVNGIKESSLTCAGYTIKPPIANTVMVLGANPVGNNATLQFFDGKIYSAAVYNYAISDATIQADAGKNLLSGETYGTLPEPSRKGYTFDGWYTAATGGTQVTSSTVTSGNNDITIYARWTKMNHVFYLGIGATRLYAASGGVIGKYDAMYHAGNILHNLSSSATNGTATDVTFGTNYMSFNGTSSYVNLGYMSADYMTLEAVFSPDEISASTVRYVITNFNSGGGGIRISTTNRIQGVFYINGDYRTVTSSTVVEVGKIYHAAVSYDGTALRLYINGIEEDSTLEYAGYTIPAPGSTAMMALGGRYSGSSTSLLFKGKIYGAAIYDKALTASQISADAGKNLATGSTYGSLSTPTRNGYTYTGWYTAPTGGSEVTSSTVFNGSSDTAIYARWEVTKHLFYLGMGATRLYTLSDGVMGKYDAMYHSGNKVYDLSNNGIDVTATDVTFGTNYMSFNGTSSWVNLGQMNSNYMTIEVIFSVEQLPSATQYIITNIQSGGFGISITNSGLIQGFFHLNGDYRSIRSTTIIETGKMYHVAISYDGTTEDMYVNGIKEDSLTYSGYTIKTPVASTVVALGADPQGSSAVGNYFAGKIYGAAVYNKALTDSQILSDSGKNLASGTTYGTLPTPARVNYSFNNWYNAATGGSTVSSSTVFSGNDTVIYARWSDTTKPTITLSKNSDATVSLTKSVTVTLADVATGLATGASVKYGWSTSRTTAPSSYTTASLSYSSGAKSTTFTATGSGITGSYYLWVVPTTLKDVAGNTQTTNTISTGAFVFGNPDTTPPTITCTITNQGTAGVSIRVNASDAESGLTTNPAGSFTITGTHTYTATNGAGLSNSCTVTVTRLTRWNKVTYTCKTGTWSGGSLLYGSTCTPVSQSSANSSNSNTYVTCTRMDPLDAINQCGSSTCYQQRTYTRTGCSAYNSSGTTQSGLTSCTASSNKNYKYTCSSYYTYTGSVS